MERSGDPLSAVMVLVAVATLFCVAAPMAGVAAGRQSGSRRVATGPTVALVVALVCSALLLRAVSDGALPWRVLLGSHITLAAAALALYQIGRLAARAFHDVLDAAAFAVAVGLVSGLGILALGPPAIDLPTGVLNAALLASPVVATAAAAQIDLLRTPALYRLSPIAHTRFDYPEWYIATTAYALTATVAGAAAFYLRQRRG